MRRDRQWPKPSPDCGHWDMGPDKRTMWLAGAGPCRAVQSGTGATILVTDEGVIGAIPVLELQTKVIRRYPKILQ